MSGVRLSQFEHKCGMHEIFVLFWSWTNKATLKKSMRHGWQNCGSTADALFEFHKPTASGPAASGRRKIQQPLEIFRAVLGLCL